MLYLLRHGRTDWNDIGKIQGSTDIKLNNDGIRMAKEASLKYKDIHFDVCFTSKLNRAIETAHLFLNGRNIKIIEDERINEYSFGECEGTILDLSDKSSYTYILFHNPKEYVPPKGGETLEQLFARCRDFINKEIKPLLKENKDVLIVSHGVALSAIVSIIENKDLEYVLNRPLNNCELISFNLKGDE